MMKILLCNLKIIFFFTLKFVESKEIFLEQCNERFCFSYEGEKSIIIDFAQKICKKKNKFLLEIYNKEMMKNFEEFKSKHTDLKKYEPWLGVEMGDPQWRWLKSGVEKQEMKINSSETSERIGSLEVFSNGEFKFKGQIQDLKLPQWICETDPNNQFCKSKGTNLKQKCFFVRNPDKKNLTWFEAQNDCIEFKATLAEFDGGEESGDLKQLPRGKPHWVGLARWAYKWRGKETPVLYSNWNENVPPNRILDSSNCSYLLGNSTWSNNKCRQFRNVVCLQERENISKNIEDLNQRFVTLDQSDIKNKIYAMLVLLVIILILILVIILKIFFCKDSKYFNFFKFFNKKKTFSLISQMKTKVSPVKMKKIKKNIINS